MCQQTGWTSDNGLKKGGIKKQTQPGCVFGGVWNDTLFQHDTCLERGKDTGVC